ncbi:hypothetical protein GCM10011399_15950 [Subtercola lobariae]|uniref:Uncharacterized protein n=1 Tax=Subtercola lobariae TaxID=1588641 RepID=A0A917B5E2_9MICO|nr:hypothetical protein GCM10011399_15950 [Subtercola lobariae]
MLYLLMSVDSVAQIIRDQSSWGGLALLGASLVMTTLSMICYGRLTRRGEAQITFSAPAGDGWAAEMEERLREEPSTVRNERRRTS